ncbi:MAG: amidohydrolase family protein [Halolamina sp.]|uniref:amidohydrolase family protein n=1 Tax=Halolamina sp. TaxID=1940283 RepID=UPI002FC276FE
MPNILDSHMHAWGPDTAEHPWETDSVVEAVTALPVATEYTAGVLLDDLDAAGVDEAVVIGLPLTHWLDNWYVENVAREYDRLYGVALLDPFADDAADELRRLMAIEDMVGFRLAPVFPRDAMYEVEPSETVQTEWLRDAIDETAFWEACAETGASVNLLAHYTHLDQVQALVEAHPELSYVVDHFGRAGADVAVDDPEFAQFADLADAGDVLVKASAIPAISDEQFPHRDVEDKIRWLLDTFGREKVAWGSDYPFISPETDYEETLTCLDRMDAVSDGEHRWLTERSFRRHVGI